MRPKTGFLIFWKSSLGFKNKTKIWVFINFFASSIGDNGGIRQSSSYYSFRDINRKLWGVGVAKIRQNLDFISNFWHQFSRKIPT